MKKNPGSEPDRVRLQKLSKRTLIEMVLELRKTLIEKDKRISELTEQLTQLNQEREEQKKKEINRNTNEPSSKKP